MPKPIAVIINDIHYNINTLLLADNVMRQAVSKSVSLGVPLIVAGDMHDTKALQRGECIKAMMETLKPGPTRRIIIPGNHCMINERSKDHSLEFLRDRCEIIDSPTYDKNMGLWFIPYQHDPIEMSRILADIPKGSTIICHQGITGSYGGHYVHDKSAVDKDAFADFRTLSGHYHRAQDIKCGRPRKGAVGLFTYTGSPYTLSFGEAYDPPKGFVVLNDDGTVDRIPTNLRNHVIIECGLTEDGWPDFVASDSYQTSGDLIWVKVHGPKSALDKLKKKDFNLGDNFKLDKIPTDASALKIDTKAKSFTENEILEQLIDNMAETPEHKDYLKKLYKDILCDL